MFVGLVLKQKNRNLEANNNLKRFLRFENSIWIKNETHIVWVTWIRNWVFFSYFIRMIVLKNSAAESRIQFAFGLNTVRILIIHVWFNAAIFKIVSRFIKSLTLSLYEVFRFSLNKPLSKEYHEFSLFRPMNWHSNGIFRPELEVMLLNMSKIRRFFKE